MLTNKQRELKDKYSFKIFSQMKGKKISDDEIKGFQDAISVLYNDTKAEEICTKGYNQAKASYLVDEQPDELYDLVEKIANENDKSMPKPKYSFEHQGITIINPIWSPDGRHLVDGKMIEFYGKNNIEKILVEYISDNDIY